MKSFLKTIAASFVFTLGLVACANMSTRQVQIQSVITSQLDVLKKTKLSREEEAFRLKIAKDPMLAEKEKLLVDALSSVIASQEAYLKLINNQNLK